MVFSTVRSLGSSLMIFSYSEIALGSLPCWTNFSACARTFTLLKPNPSAIKKSVNLRAAFPNAVGNCKRVQLGLKYHRKTAKPKLHGVIVSTCRLFTLKVQAFWPGPGEGLCPAWIVSGLERKRQR